MSNLIPVQRVDKNGVLTTKHVRAGVKSAASNNPMPAPKISAVPDSEVMPRGYKSPTKFQLRQEPRVFTASVENPDPQLLEALGLPPTDFTGIYRFSASTHQLYEMMARIGTGNSLALMEAGYKTVPDAMQFLSEHDMTHLKELRPIALEAQERRIAVEDFVRVTRFATAESLNNPNFLDYMEVSGIASFSEFKDLPNDVYEGKIKLSDIKAVGVTRISKSIGWNVTEDALRKIADGTAGYTAEDLKIVLTRFGDASDVYIENALDLTERYGVGLMKTIENPSTSLMLVERDLRLEDIDPERIKGLLKFRDDFATETGNFLIPFTDEEVSRFYDANVSPADAATGRVTLMQLDAIDEHGISPSVSGGWL